MRTSFATALLVALAGCQSPVAPPEPPQTAAQPEAKPEVVLPDVQFPRERLALPLEVVRLRLPKDVSVGTVSGIDFEGEAPLRALGVNVCQTGWFIQGYVERGGEIHTTPGFLLELAELPTGPFIYRVPGVQGSHLEIDLKDFSLEHAAGKIAVVQDTGEKTFEMTFDGAPMGVSAQPNFGAQGCYTTGYFRIGEKQGPVTAVFDGKDLYYVGMRLDERHSIAFMLSLRADLRKPGNVLQGSLNMIEENPKKFPFRIFAETRANREGVANQPLLETQQVMVKEGLLRASFGSTEAKGPIRIDLADLQLPEWDGPYSGLKLPRVQVEALFVTDPESAIVPVPSSPNWQTVKP